MSPSDEQKLLTRVPSFSVKLRGSDQALFPLGPGGVRLPTTAKLQGGCS